MSPSIRRAASPRHWRENLQDRFVKRTRDFHEAFGCEHQHVSESERSDDVHRDSSRRVQTDASSRSLPLRTSESEEDVNDEESDDSEQGDEFETDAHSEACPRSPRSAATHGHIYKWTSPSGKGYVGQSRRAQRHRKNEHNSGGSSCHALKHAFKKYGKDNMRYEVLADNVPIEELDQREQEMVDLHQTLKPNGYNQIKVAQFKDKCGAIRNHQARCKEVMGSERMRNRKSEMWHDDAEWRAQQIATRKRAQGNIEHVEGRRSVFEAKRKALEATMSEPDRMLHAELARRDAVQGARRTIRNGVGKDRDPMAEVIAVYGDGSAWKAWKAVHPAEAKAAAAKHYAAMGRTPGNRKLTADTIG